MGFRLIIILKTKPHFNEIIMKQNWFRELETQKWLKWARFNFFTKKIKISRYRLVQKCWNSDYWLISELRLIPTIKFWFGIWKRRPKLGCVVRMVVDSILSHAECGPNDHRKDASLFTCSIQKLDSGNVPQ